MKFEKFAPLLIPGRSFCTSTLHAYFLMDVQKSHCLSNVEKVPKSMKNVRFGSGFLHVIHKLTLQDNPTFIYYQLTLYAAV